MVPSNFEGLVGYRTLRDEGQVPLKAYGCVFGRVSQASVCIAHIRAIPTYRVGRLCDKRIIGLQTLMLPDNLHPSFLSPATHPLPLIFQPPPPYIPRPSPLPQV